MMRIDIRDTYRSSVAEWAPLPEAIYAYLKEEADTARMRLKRRKGYQHIDGVKIRCNRTGRDTRVTYAITVKIRRSPGFIYEGVFDIEETGKLAVGDFTCALIATLDDGMREDRDDICLGFDEILTEDRR